MRKALLCFKRSRTNSYAGGVVTMINYYLDHRQNFADCGYDLGLFDYHPGFSLKNSKLNNVLYGFAQCSAMLNHLRDKPCDVVNIHTSSAFLFLKDVWLAKNIKKRRNTKVILTIHVGAAETVFRRIKPFQKQCIGILNRYVDRVVFLSEAIRDEFIVFGFDVTRAEVLYNFHCLAPVTEGDELPVTAKMHLLFVGAIHKDKGILELLRAMQAMPELDLHLDICGKLTDRTIEDEIDDLVGRLGDRVTCHGYVRGVQKSTLFRRADVLLLPSYHEGFPLVVLEAMASGCAVISTPVGATPEVLTEKNAIWVQIGSVEDICAAVRRLEQDVQLLDDMKQENLALSEKFSIEAHIQKLCRIYGE